MCSWKQAFSLCFFILAHAAGAFASCDQTYQKIGCFHEGKTNMKLIVNDRDGKGIDVNWKAFNESIASLQCRCAKKASDEGYEYFSIRFYAECWAGKSFSDVNVNENTSPSGCVNTKFKTCTKADSRCVGKEHFEFMYKMVSSWSEWSAWSECSVPCDTGVQTRKRDCQGDDNDSCVGDAEETRVCNEDDCPSCDWKAGQFGIGSSEESVPNIKTKEECLNACLRKKSRTINAVNFFSSQPSECYCVSGVAGQSGDSSAIFCNLDYVFPF